MGVGKVQGRQGGNPFYPSEKVHENRNKDKKIKQRKLPKPQVSLCTKNHREAIYRTIDWGLRTS